MTLSCLGRFDNTCKLTQTLCWKQLCQSSTLQCFARSLSCEDADAFKPCASQVSRLCIAPLLVYVRTGVTRELSLIADGHTVWEWWVLFSAFWGKSLLSCLLSPSHHINSSPPLHPALLKSLHNNCKFYNAQISLFPLTQKQTDC